MAKTNTQMDLSAKIEAAAAAYKAASFGKRETAEFKLINLLLEYKGLYAFANLSNSESRTMDQLYNADEYSGIIFTEVYQFARDHYGKLDVKTGNRIPFLKLFNYAYSLKKSDLLREQLEETKGDDQAIKRAKLRELAYSAGKNEGIAITSKDLDFNLLNRSKLAEMLVNKGFSDEVFEQAMAILDNSHICGLEAGGNEDDEDSDGLLSDTGDHAKYELAKRVLMQLADRIDRESVKLIKPNDKKLLKLLVTVEFCKYIPSFAELNPTLLLGQYLDLGFMNFCRNNPQFKDTEDALAAYSGKKRETLLKNFSRVRKLLAA